MKNLINLSSAESAYRVVCVNMIMVSIDPDNELFSYFPTKTYIVGNQKCPNKTEKYLMIVLE